MNIVLRPYQADAVSALLSHLEAEPADNHGLIVLPTGAGKSVVIAETIRQVLAAHGDWRILNLIHRRELVDQNAAKLAALGVDAGIYSAGLSRRDTSHRVIVAGIQSLARGVRSCLEAGRFDLVIIDEAHRLPPPGESQYQSVLAALLEANPELRLAGLTATPGRLGQGMLTDPGRDGQPPQFSRIVYQADMKQLIRDGYLSDLVGYEGEFSVKTDGLKIRRGDFLDAEVAGRFADIQDACIDEIIRRGESRRGWVVFASSTGQAEHILARMRSAGIAAGLVLGSTPDDVRDGVVSDFRTEKLRCIVNLNVLCEGFDAPHADLVALMRATVSPGLLVQMAGRGSRVHPGKENCMILDFGQNIARHGPIDMVGYERPGARRSGGVAITAPCPECRAHIQPRASVCRYCGAEVRRSGAGWAGLAGTSISLPSHVLSQDGAAATRPAQAAHGRWVAVSGVRFSLHKPRGRPECIKVDYSTASGVVSEWLSLAYDGYPIMAAKKRLKSLLTEAAWGRVEPHLAARDARLVLSALPKSEAGSGRKISEIYTRPKGNFINVLKVR